MLSHYVSGAGYEVSSYLAKSSLQLVDQIQEVPLLPGQLVVHLVMAVLRAGPQSPLVNLGLTGSQGALLSHDGLLQGPQSVVHLAVYKFTKYSYGTFGQTD